MMNSPHFQATVAPHAHDTEDFHYGKYLLKVSKKFINALDPEQKFWLLQAIAGMIVADGKITHEEVAFAEYIFGQCELTEKEMETIKTIMNTRRKPDLPLMTLFSPHKRETALKILIWVSIADLEFHPEEEAFFMKIGEKMACEPKLLETLIQWGHAEIERIQKIPSATNFPP